MIFEYTEWHRTNPNYWCAIDRITHKLIGADCDLSKLAEYIDEKNLNDEVVFCRNWTRPMPYADMKPSEIEKHRLFLKEHRSQKELDEFDERLSSQMSY